MLLVSGLAFAATWAGFQFYARRLEQRVAGGPKVAVLVATEDLKVGAELTQARLSSVDIPRSYVDDRRVLDKDRAQVLGAQLATELKAGQALVWSDVATAEGPQRLSLVLPRGRRAYSLPSKVNPMGALLRADDEVDVLLLRAGRAEVLLEKIRILGVGRILRGEEDAAKAESYRASDTVTLDVTLSQAQTLMSSEGQGQLRLVLRHPEDEGVVGPKVPLTQSTVQAAALDPKREIEHVR